MEQQTVLNEQAVKDFFMKLMDSIPDADIWYGYFYVQQKFMELLFGRDSHVDESEAEFIKGLYQAEYNFRQIQNITGRSLETISRILKEESNNE